MKETLVRISGLINNLKDGFKEKSADPTIDSTVDPTIDRFQDESTHIRLPRDVITSTAPSSRVYRP